jgi:hypothetical protein
MKLTLDQKPLHPNLPSAPTLGHLLDWLHANPQATGRVVVRIVIDGNALEGDALNQSENLPLTGRSVAIETAQQSELSHTMLGKLAALVDFLGQRQHAIADLLSQGDSPKALAQLSDLLSAWHQVQQAFTSLTRLLRVDLTRQIVGDRPAMQLVDEFRGHLEEIQLALQNQDMVLLGDVLQYEMDAAIKNWNDLLATTLGIVDGVVELAA